MNSLTQIPKGTQILIGPAVRRRRALERVVFSVFEGWCYEEMIPPMFDYLDVFVQGMGQELEDRIYRFIDREGNVLALRPEFTSLVAKAAATRLSGAPTPLRLSYSGEVLRFETPKGGQQREFAQIGIEHYGGFPERADVEVLLVCMEGLSALGVEDYQINLGSVDFFGGLIDGMSLDASKVDQLRSRLDIKDEDGLEQLVSGFDTDETTRALLSELPHLTGDREVIVRARSMARAPRSVQALDHLDSIWGILEGLGLSGHLTIDLGEVRGFDYYSGMLFRAYVPGLGFEVASGGRYDGLPAQFGYDVPAVGFSYSVDRLEQVVGVSEADGEEPSEEKRFDAAVRLRKAGRRVRLCS
jgi:ATP phosphoribosyltransferase regulatory subunit